ncbi:ASFV_G_ACD_00290 [African swine fever virus]|uniref:ASFV_G_ACD_00290 n=1 Tax=African swine fever virus TaxID=10497 RepID=A0A5B8XD50_ASF|nr:ASFV_G_ACD_00290 [African swine fever virus]
MFELSSILIRGGVLIVLILLWIVEYNEDFIDAIMMNSSMPV